MLILQRKRGERLMIGPDVEVTVLEVRGQHVKLGFSGPSQVAIHRGEVVRRAGKTLSAERGPDAP